MSCLLAFAACASDPVPGDSARPTSDAVVVRLVGAGFVLVDGERTTVEELVYDLRVRCRAAGDDPAARPWLRIVAPQDGSDGLNDLADRLRRAAHDAGVRHVELELEGA